MTDAVARARRDLDAGRPWKARDRLLGLLATRHDEEVLDLLATVYDEMRDLPAAGALWSIAGRNDECAQRAIEAWRERHGSAEARWQSLPTSVRESPADRRVREIQRAAKQAAEARWHQKRAEARHDAEASWGDRVSGFFSVLFVLWVIVMSVIGFVTVQVWIWT